MFRFVTKSFWIFCLVDCSFRELDNCAEWGNEVWVEGQFEQCYFFVLAMESGLSSVGCT